MYALPQVIAAEPAVRMFDILRKEGYNYVTQADLKSMMAGILLSHPGLEFLQETPEFQDRCPSAPNLHLGREVPCRLVSNQHHAEPGNSSHAVALASP